MFDITKFGAFISRLRKNADMTQSELADRLGLTRQAISRYECGDSFPDISVLRELAGIFGIPLELLINSGDPTEGEAEIIEAVASGREITPKNAADVLSLAPLLKPSVLSRLSDSMAKQGIDMSGITALAEYLNDTDARKLLQSVSFDSLSEMDPNLLERLLPLLGPYAADTVFQKILDGELDYHYLELLGNYSNSAVEAAVVFGALDAEALNIMRRNNYNRARLQKRGVIRLFTCPECGGALTHFYPRRCKCGCQPAFSDNILRMCEPEPVCALSAEKPDFDLIRRRMSDELLILVLGASGVAGLMDMVFERDFSSCEAVILDDDPSRLNEAERSVRNKNSGQLLFALDDLRAPHLMPDMFDLIIDNTAGHIGERGELLTLLKKGGCVMRGDRIVCEV